MMTDRRGNVFCFYLSLALLCFVDPVCADGLAVKIGVITDMADSLSSQCGEGSVIAARMAADEGLAAECRGMKIEILAADHQNKPDIAVATVRKWIDVDGVNAVTDRFLAL
jgi:branched-chain amino acid transport system substrate-binding protein